MKVVTWVSPMKRTKPRQVQTPDPNAANVPIIFVVAQNGFKNDTAADNSCPHKLRVALRKTYFIFSRQMLLPYVAANNVASLR